MTDEKVADVAELYLGNILYAIELAAMSLEEQGKPADAAFYRGIARKLAEAHADRHSRESGNPSSHSRESGNPSSHSRESGNQ